ncbi:MAG: outer membrane beta-barrel domain-containing protein [Myxococcales bacterium]|nr:outer membrane beta-barrel domain-containing protein [Myxococcales bacterium]MCB9642885.1 outer membrane beta-barrel domain-containing protein [Myxococcales bacterium]
MRTERRISYVLLSLCLLWIGLPTKVSAAPLTEDRVDVFQLKSITKKRRHELSGIFAGSFNDGFMQTVMGGASYTFHATEGFGFEVLGLFGTGFNTTITDRLRAGTGTTPTPEGQELKIKPEFARPQIMAFGSFVWSPFPGKFQVGNGIVDMDAYITAGAGYIRTNQSDLFGVSFGLGMRWMIASWFFIRMDVRDFIFSQSLLGGNVSVLNHNLMATVGVGFVLPVTSLYTS